MRVVALVSGGKDSCFNMMQCVAEGHTIVALANLRPKDKDELDSYMFQTVGHHAIELYAEAMGLPLYRRTIAGGSVNQARDYSTTAQDEVEDLFHLLSEIKEEVDYEAVSVGAILSDYQRVRVEHVCLRLGVTALAYLWRRDQSELLAEMIQCHVNAIVIKVAALGLSPEKHLGKSLQEIYPHMLNMYSQYGLNPCGEGGEYETFTLDCPLFKKSIVVEEQEVVMHSSDPISPVAYINFRKMRLQDKQCVAENQQERIKQLTMARSGGIMAELYGSDSPPPQGSEDVNTAGDTCLNCTLHRLEDVTTFERRSASGWFHCSGIVGRKEDGGSVEEQTRAAMERLTGILTRHQLEVRHLAAVHIYVTNMADFARINSVYKMYFGINPPIRICVEADLASNVCVQLDATGHHSGRGEGPGHRTMHVQGVSHWAPANIGPYSQCVQVNDVILYVAGQIPLVPGSMRIVEGGIYPQARLSLRHVDRVLRAMQAPTGPPLHIGCVRLAICYVTSKRFIRVAEAEWSAYHNRLSDDDTTHCEGRIGLVEYVVISRLPRDAMIEWQVLAVPSSAHLTENSSRLRSDKAEANCRCCVSEVDTQWAATFICKLDSSEEISQPQPLTREATGEALVTSLRCIKEALHGVTSQRDDPTQGQDLLWQDGVLRVFYNVHHFDINMLEKEYVAAWRLCMGDGSPPAPAAFVPVRTFRDSRQLLSICH